MVCLDSDILFFVKAEGLLSYMGKLDLNYSEASAIP